MIGLDDPVFLNDPYPVYAKLRESDPVCWFPPMKAWLVSKHSAVKALLRDPRISAGGKRFTKGLDIFPPEVRAQYGEFAAALGRMMLFHDPPEHTRLRRQLNPEFTPSTIDKLRADVLAVVGDLSRAFPIGTFDLVEQFTRPFPAHVICALLGVPADVRSQLVKWSDDLADFFVAAPPTQAQLQQAARSTLELTAWFRARALASDAVRKDLIDTISQFNVGAENLTPDEVASQCVLLLFGGQETLRNTISTGVYLLAKYPKQLELLRSTPALLPKAIEEILRFESPVQWIARVAKEKMEIEGVAIEPGQPIFLLLGAANRDSEVFEQPDCFDIARDGKNMAFGSGPHRCLGEALGRLEIELALKHLLLDRTDLTVADQPFVWTPHLALRGLRQLEVVVNPVQT